MRHLNLSIRFNKIVLAVRLIGLGIGLLGLLLIAVTADLLGILIAVAGSIVWQCGTFLEERSPGFRALNSILARDVMKTERMNVPPTMNMGDLRAKSAFSEAEAFFVTMQDGYESGIVLPEDLHAVRDGEARRLSLDEVTRPISYVDAIRDDDSLLTALTAMDRYGRDYVIVLNRHEQLNGIVTRAAIASATRDQKMKPVLNSPVLFEGIRAKAA